MDYNKIKFATLEVFKKCNIKSFPIDCISILRSYGMSVKTYSSQKPKKKEQCLSYSKDAFILKRTVYYNDEVIHGRARFSLAHEIGHIALEHKMPRTDEQEKEADCFASYLLAPRMAIHYAKCKNHVDVARQFKTTYEAAQYAFDDYRRWHRKAVYKMDDFDKSIYTHFYNKEQKKFVYNITYCIECDRAIYNSSIAKCPVCTSRHSLYYSVEDKYFHAAENNWLYGGL